MPRLVIRKSDALADWWVIERAEHNHTKGLGRHPIVGCGVLIDSARISDADVEGTGEEMRSLATAIQARKPESFKRCAFRMEDGAACFWSPRNSTHDGRCSPAEADELAEMILATVPA